MKEGWKRVALVECCDILDSLRKPITKAKRVKGTIPYYGATGLLDYVKDYIFDEPLVLLGEDGAKWGAGETSAYEISGKAWVNNHAHVLRPHKDKLFNAWLVYYLNYKNLMPYITGITVPKLNQKRMCSIIIPVPPLSEQQRIVSYLDSAFAKIDAVAKNAEKSLNEAKALFQSALTKMMEPKEGWEEKTLGDCCEILDAKRKPIKKEKREKGSIPYYGATGLLDYVKDYIFDETLVLLGEDGAKWGAGETSAYEISGKSWINNHAHVLRPNKDVIINAWLIYYLNYSNLMPYIKGVTVPKLNQQRMSIINIPIPSLSEQQHIASYLDSLKSKVDQLQSNLSLTLSECAALKQSILRQTFE